MIWDRRRRRQLEQRRREDARGLHGEVGRFEVGVVFQLDGVTALEAERAVADLLEQLVGTGRVTEAICDIDAGWVATIARTYPEDDLGGS